MRAPIVSLRAALGVAALASAVAALVYFAWLRPDYRTLFNELRADDAATIVAELEKQGVPHRLGEGGASILVREDRLDAARISIAGADLQLKGDVGFELFNESDMGLTEFAQKINYLRALQGELARTIMATDGIDRARVHLAIPERALFRATPVRPTAAVTLHPKPGIRLEPARVEGVQRLVAFAVPDMAFEDVAVLDEKGRMISRAASEDAGAADGMTVLERDHVERARAALAAALPGVPLTIEARTIMIEATPDTLDRAAPDQVGGAPLAADARNYRLRLTVRTRTLLDPGASRAARQALESVLGLDAARGDVVIFALEMPPLPLDAPIHDAESRAEPAMAAGATSAGWWAALAAIAIAVAVGWALNAGRRRALSEEEAGTLATRLDERFAPTDEPVRHAAA